MEFLTFAFEMDQTDDVTLRLTCGLISDLSNCSPDSMPAFLDKLIPKLQKVLNDENFEIETQL